jgi:hypothetical protein
MFITVHVSDHECIREGAALKYIGIGDGCAVESRIKWRPRERRRRHANALGIALLHRSQ